MDDHRVHVADISAPLQNQLSTTATALYICTSTSLMQAVHLKEHFRSCEAKADAWPWHVVSNVATTFV